MRKITALILALSLVLAFSSCTAVKIEESTGIITESAVQGEITAFSEEASSSSAEATALPETTAMPETTTVPETTTAEITTAPVVSEIQTTAPVKEDVTLWDTERVVEFYKNAAAATGSSVQSSQTVGLSDISVNNGQLGGVFSFVTPILSSFLSSKATVTDGITGEYDKLTASDAVTAVAYESAGGTVVEITLNEQTDAGGTDSDGSVAHGIYIVGDLLSVMGQLKEKGLPIEIDTEKAVIKYTNPVIRVLVSGDGKIVNGTWSCTVEISLSDYKFAGSPVNSTVVVLDNKITVNGGFAG
ncbi:MAG: hypothetical protein IJN70_08285 [Clostridia bacterium]|nr:hypothetical protein [Clostridia bacterium]